jgi:hypothetical protein
MAPVGILHVMSGGLDDIVWREPEPGFGIY